MSREIKFRAWVEEGKWDYYVYDIQKRADMAEWFGQSAIHIEQYTGLKDKNGKEIYEGDIIKCKFFIMNFVVEYDELCAMFCTKECGNGHIESFEEWDEKNLEVIGNIHENPELLEDEE